CEHGCPDHFAAVGLQVTLHVDCPRAAQRLRSTRSGREFPGAAPWHFSVNDAVVMQEILRSAEGFSSLREAAQVVPVRNEPAGHRCDSARHQTAVGEVAEAHCDIDTLLDEIDETVVEAKIDPHALVPGEE